MENVVASHTPIICEIEREVAEKIRNDIFIPQEAIIIVETDFYDEVDGKLWFNKSYLLDRKTFDRIGFEKKYTVLSDAQELEIMQPIYDLTSYGCVNADRYREYVRKYGWTIVFPVSGRGKMYE